MTSAHVISNVLLKLSQPDVGDVITNLKMQKLLYYAQGLHLAINNGEPLFTEDIVAWNYGPVVPDVYHRFKEFGSNPIPVPDDVDTSNLNGEQIELIKDVYEAFGQFSALKLMHMTHSESPWIETNQSEVITHDKLISHFAPYVIK